MPVPASDLCLVLTTTGSRDEAERLAHALVEQRLAACVNIIPGLTSVYRWKGQVESADEVLLLMKTTASNLQRLEESVRALHSYEVPEILVIQPDSASEAYLQWLLDSASS